MVFENSNNIFANDTTVLRAINDVKEIEENIQTIKKSSVDVGLKKFEENLTEAGQTIIKCFDQLEEVFEGAMRKNSPTISIYNYGGAEYVGYISTSLGEFKINRPQKNVVAILPYGSDNNIKMEIYFDNTGHPTDISGSQYGYDDSVKAKTFQFERGNINVLSKEMLRSIERLFDVKDIERNLKNAVYSHCQSVMQSVSRELSQMKESPASYFAEYGAKNNNSDVEKDQDEIDFFALD